MSSLPFAASLRPAHLAAAALQLLKCLRPELLTHLLGAVRLLPCVIEAHAWPLLKSNLLVVVDGLLLGRLLTQLYACRQGNSELAPLNRGKL